MGKKVEMIGKRFGRLTVLNETERRDKNGNIYYECKCDCGKFVTVIGTSLRRKATKSCGCLNREKITKENPFYKDKLYRVWASMKGRCYNKNNKAYCNYGAREIYICEEWKKDYAAFRDWAVSNNYKDGLTIDRIDNDKGYSPDNCRWVTMKEQQNNKRCNRKITINGETKTVKEWSEYANIQYATLVRRLELGWSDDNLLKPANQKYNHSIKQRGLNNEN